MGNRAPASRPAATQPRDRAPAPTITLAFDNGPEPEVTPRGLDVLRAQGLWATFVVRNRGARFAQDVPDFCLWMRSEVDVGSMAGVVAMGAAA